MAKYINAEKLKAEIERRMKILNKYKGTHESAAAARQELVWLSNFIDKMEQDAPTPPGIEEESQRKGWLDYGLMMSEIGLHRYNAIHRIKEHKEQFNPQAVPDLYHVAEYYKAVGVELTCCCLQAYGKDFIFTQDEVKEIIEKENAEK